MGKSSSSGEFKLGSPLVDHGVEFWTIETYYQAMKVSDSDLGMKQWIASLSPDVAREAGRLFDGMRQLELEESKLSRPDEAQLSRIHGAKREIIEAFPEGARGLAERAQVRTEWPAIRDVVFSTAVRQAFAPDTPAYERLRSTGEREMGVNTPLGQLLTEIRDGSKQREESNFGESRYSTVQGNNPLQYDAQDPWGGLTDEERRLLTAKYTTVKDSSNPAKEEIAAAGKVFNEQAQVKNNGVLDIKKTETQIASVQNFVAEFSGDPKIWNEVQSIVGVGSMGVGKQSDIAFTVGNRENFLAALKNTTDAHGYKRFYYQGDAQGHIDSTRELGYGVSDPSMHIERYPDKWYAHWDPTSFFTKPTVKEFLLDASPVGVLRRPAAGLAHIVMDRAEIEDVKDFLKDQGLVRTEKGRTEKGGSEWPQR